MAQVATVSTLCDACGDDVIKPHKPIVLKFGNKEYSPDLCETHVKELEGFISYLPATKAKAAGTTRRKQRNSSVDPAVVRAWAKENNYEVSERGRIAAGLIEAFQAATA